MLTLYQDVEISDIAYFQEFSRNPYFTGVKAGLHVFKRSVAVVIVNLKML